MISQLHFNHNVGSIDAFSTERGAADCFSPYSEFNCCGYTGDNPAHVDDCLKRLRTLLGTEHIVTARQTHSTNVPLSTAFRRLHRPMSTRLSHDSRM